MRVLMYVNAAAALLSKGRVYNLRGQHTEDRPYTTFVTGPLVVWFAPSELSEENRQTLAMFATHNDPRVDSRFAQGCPMANSLHKWRATYGGGSLQLLPSGEHVPTGDPDFVLPDPWQDPSLWSRPGAPKALVDAYRSACDPTTNGLSERLHILGKICSHGETQTETEQPKPKQSKPKRAAAKPRVRVEKVWERAVTGPAKPRYRKGE